MDRSQVIIAHSRKKSARSSDFVEYPISIRTPVTPDASSKYFYQIISRNLATVGYRIGTPTRMENEEDFNQFCEVNRELHSNIYFDNNKWKPYQTHLLCLFSSNTQHFLFQQSNQLLISLIAITLIAEIKMSTKDPFLSKNLLGSTRLKQGLSRKLAPCTPSAIDSQTHHMNMGSRIGTPYRRAVVGSRVA